MLLRQLFDRPLLDVHLSAGGSRPRARRLLIDPVFEQPQRDAALIRELELTLRYTLDTHLHADHVTGAWLLRERLGSRDRRLARQRRARAPIGRVARRRSSSTFGGAISPCGRRRAHRRLPDAT